MVTGINVDQRKKNNHPDDLKLGYGSHLVRGIQNSVAPPDSADKGVVATGGQSFS